MFGVESGFGNSHDWLAGLAQVPQGRPLHGLKSARTRLNKTAETNRNTLIAVACSKCALACVVVVVMEMRAHWGLYLQVPLASECTGQNKM